MIEITKLINKWIKEKPSRKKTYDEERKKYKKIIEKINKNRNSH